MRFFAIGNELKQCSICGKKSKVISESISVCADCLREYPDQALEKALKNHAISRSKWKLPPQVPRDEMGIACNNCSVKCKIPNGGKGYCGLIYNRDGKLTRLDGGPIYGVCEYYYDPLPCNCVAIWTCPGGSEKGYPKFSYRKGSEYGFFNLAVFYGACNLDCLFCQNWSYRGYASSLSPRVHYKELASKVHDKVSCICFFGGDPGPQVGHAIMTSREALNLARKRNRILRICWETNGQVNPKIMNRMASLSLESGGIVKIDFKAWSNPVYKALTGVDLGYVKENILRVYEMGIERQEVPLLVVSVLLVPGYVDEYELRGITSYLASIDRDIPVSFLAFHPDYVMNDIPPTSISHARMALNIARESGLRNFKLMNTWLLGDYY